MAKLFAELNENEFDVNLESLSEENVAALAKQFGIRTKGIENEDLLIEILNFTEGDNCALRDALLRIGVEESDSCFTIKKGGRAEKSTKAPKAPKKAAAPTEAARTFDLSALTKAGAMAMALSFGHQLDANITLAELRDMLSASSDEELFSAFEEAGGDANDVRIGAAPATPAPAPKKRKEVEVAPLDSKTASNLLKSEPSEESTAEFMAAFKKFAAPSLNAEQVGAIVQSEIIRALGILEIPTNTIVVQDKVKVDLGTEHLHPAFKDLLDLAGLRKNILMVGAAGSGKTHAAHQVSRALGLEFASISVTAGMSTSQITGWILPDGYRESDFVRIYENGGVFLFDEIDAADANTLTVINQALANGGFHIAQRTGNTEVKKHKDFVCIAAANTFGTGADLIYAGREQLDAATLDRFNVVLVDYDEKFEAIVATGDVLEFAHKARKAISNLKLRRVMSTRRIMDLSDLRRIGWPLTKVMDSYFASWSADEKMKVLNAIGIPSPL